MIQTSGMSKRQLALQFVNFLLIVSTALMIWKGLGILFNTESPIVVVLSESMEPAFRRGDLLFLNHPSTRIDIGDIVVFTLKQRDIPIVHRVLKVHDELKTGKQFILTKGDNNNVDDRGLYNRGQLWIHRDDIMGKVYGHLPGVGMLTIIMNDYPWFKFIVLGGMALYVLVNRE